jgi:hypothetical protein
MSDGATQYDICPSRYKKPVDILAAAGTPAPVENQK